MVLFYIATGTVFAWLLSYSGFADNIANVLVSISSSPIILMCLVVTFIFFLGLVIEGMAILIMFGSILGPIMAQLGVDPIQFGVIIVMAVLVGSITPPVGILLYMSCGIAGIKPFEAFGIVWPFISIYMFLLYLSIFVPLVITFFPSFMG